MIFVSVPIGWFAIIPKIDIVQGFWRVDINWNIILAVYLAGVDIEKIFEGFVMSTEFAGICETYGISQGQMNLSQRILQTQSMYQFSTRHSLEESLMSLATNYG